MDTASQNPRSLRTYGIAVMVMLILQYILGMVSNLYVQFPDTKNPGQLWQSAWSQIPLAVHIILGVLILIGGIVLFVRSLRNKNRLWIRASGWGLLFVVIAGLSGSQFVTTQNDALSFAMSLGFMGALLCYAGGLYKTKNNN